MREVVRREFVVDVPLHVAWEHLADVEAWPSWAKHIRKVTLHPSGPLTERSAGAFGFAGGVRSTFRMEVFEPPVRWQWVGRLPTFEIHYDHRFAVVDDTSTRLTWRVMVDGSGAGTLGRAFGVFYARNLDRAIPNLCSELRTRS